MVWVEHPSGTVSVVTMWTALDEEDVSIRNACFLNTLAVSSSPHFSHTVHGITYIILCRNAFFLNKIAVSSSKHYSHTVHGITYIIVCRNMCFLNILAVSSSPHYSHTVHGKTYIMVYIILYHCIHYRV
jgi:hypothetical protein